jgi:hypothetical protein
VPALDETLGDRISHAAGSGDTDFHDVPSSGMLLKG